MQQTGSNAAEGQQHGKRRCSDKSSRAGLVSHVLQ
jgi:hypothetical protein